jgi:acyl-CoA synthetase (AMP-forming)/AMP-acid ligase II
MASAGPAPPAVTRRPSDIAQSCVVSHAAQHPHRIALVMAEGPSRTYWQLHERTNRLAQALLANGIAPGARVAVWLGNRLEYLETYLACAKAGFVVVPVNIRFTVHEAGYILDHSGAQALVYGPEVDQRVDELAGLRELRLVLRVGPSIPGATEFESFLAAGADALPAPPPEDALLVIGYTSGTTGLPKGALLTHRSVSRLGLTNAVSCRYVMGSVQIFGLSLSFTATVPAHILPHLAIGGTTVVLPAWDTERMLRECQRHRADFLILPSPPILDFVTIAGRDPALVGSLRAVLHSASKAPPEHLEALVGVLGSRLVEGWGMTENSGGLLTATSAADYQRQRTAIFSSVGQAVIGTTVRVVDSEGRPMPHDGSTVGEIIATSGSLACGYWNDATATAAAFRDGWYHTGDLGTVDTDGYVSLVDRRTDLIISGGMNVYPSEVERALHLLPGVCDCAAVGTPHPRWGQTPVAFVVATGSALTSAEVVRHCRTLLADFKLPTAVHLVDELPRNASGKLRRDVLVQWARAAAATGH